MDSKQFFYNFGKSLYRIDGFYAEYAKESNIKENLLWILYALNDGEEHSQKEISDSWDLPRTTINTIIKELQGDGFIELVQIKGEKRELNVKLTESGKKYADELLAELYEIEKRVFEQLKDDSILTEMNDLLEKLNEEKRRIK